MSSRPVCGALAIQRPDGACASDLFLGGPHVVVLCLTTYRGIRQLARIRHGQPCAFWHGSAKGYHPGLSFGSIQWSNAISKSIFGRGKGCRYGIRSEPGVMGLWGVAVGCAGASVFSRLSEIPCLLTRVITNTKGERERLPSSNMRGGRPKRSGPTQGGKTRLCMRQGRQAGSDQPHTSNPRRI